MVSLCATVFNEADSIGAWVRGLDRQSLTPDEIVICDAGSTDGTVEGARMRPTEKTCWPEWVRDNAGETFPVRLLPSADQISRADLFFAALNKLESEPERKEIYTWCKIQASKNRTIRGYADKMGLREHEYRRSIDKIFQKVAVHFNISSGLMSFAPVEQCEETGHKRSSSDEAYPSNWMEQGAKPRASDETPQRQNCMRAMLARSAERMGEVPGRQRAES